MWCLRTRFSGGLCSVNLTLGLNDPKSNLQPKYFDDSSCQIYLEFSHLSLKQGLRRDIKLDVCSAPHGSIYFTFQKGTAE